MQFLPGWVPDQFRGWKDGKDKEKICLVADFFVIAIHLK